MASRFKGFIVILSIGMLIYLISLANTSVAEDTENEALGRFAGAVVSVEASVVMVGPGTMKEITGDSEIKILNTIPLERIMRTGRIVSSVKLSMRNGSNAEMEIENSEEISNKKAEEEKAEQISTETQVFFRATSNIIDIEKIEISFGFEHIFLENTSGSTDTAEEQIRTVRKFEMSSAVILRPGEPRIVGVTKKDVTMFLIMCADI